MPTAELVRRDGVELARSGVWPAMTGPWTASAEDFAAAIAAMSCPAVRRPYVRVGHVDARFGGRAVNPAGDGEPAVGWVENPRLVDGGNTLVGDIVGLPAWLDTVLASAYPDRSVEGAYNRRCQLGHSHPFVLDGVALLGVTRPGVGTLKPIGGLGDVEALFGPDAIAASVDEVRIAASISAAADTEPGDGDENNLRNYWVFGKGRLRWKSWTELYEHIKRHVKPAERAKRIAASWFHLRYGYWPGDHRNKDKVAAADGGLMPNPNPSLADRVREAWNASGAPFSQHVHQVRAGVAIVLDESDRSFWRVPVTVDGDSVAFGDKQRVMPDFVDYDETLVAASTTFATREESRPDVDATVLDPPFSPPDPSPPAEPAPPGGPPPEEEPVETPPDEGGVPASNPEETPSAELVTEDTEPKEGGVSTLMSDVRSRLGLPEDADEAAVLTALDGLKQQADKPTEPTPDQVAASAAKDAENEELRKEVSVLASQMQQVTGELAQAKADKAATVKASVLDDAQKQGKFTPAAREQWDKDYDEAPAAVTRILASIAAGTAVPVTPAGYTGTGDETSGDVIDAEYERLFNVPQKTGA